MSIFTGTTQPLADEKIIQFEIIGEFVFSISAKITWRGKRTFEAGVTDTTTGVTSVTTCHRLGLAKRAYREYQRTWR